MFVASSFSKNFGLYRERIGALTLVAPDADAADIVHSQVLITIRTNYSNPPAHGVIEQWSVGPGHGPHRTDQPRRPNTHRYSRWSTLDHLTRRMD